MATTTSQVGPYDQVYYDTTLIDSALEMLVHTIPLQKRSLPRRNGKVVNFREFQVFSEKTTALTEGVTPTPDSYTVREVTATIAQYGARVGITDMIDATKPDDHLTQITENQGYQAGLTVDTLIANQVVLAASNDYYGTAAGTVGTTVGNTAAVIDATMLDKMHRVMRNNNAPYYTEIIGAGPGQGTMPVAPCYLAIVHPSVGYTLRRIEGFLPIEQYGGSTGRMTGEIGSYKNFRFLESTNALVRASAGSGSADVYVTAFFSPNAAATVELNGMSLRSYHQPFGSGDDTLEQRAYQGWKMSFVSKILNDAFLATLGNTIES